MGTHSNSTPPDQPSPADGMFDSEPSATSGSQPDSAGGAAAGDDAAMTDVGSLLSAAMLTFGSSAAFYVTTGDDIYDGNVPLAGDLTSALDSTLDLLTTTTSLFDVPVLDIGSSDAFDG